MSRSNQTQTKNPANRFFEWSGSEGKIKCYDKERGVRALLDLPFTFIVLDQLACVVGYSDAEDCGYYSNEVRDTRTNPLVVRYAKNNSEAFRGLYKDMNLPGAKFAWSVYIAYKDGDKLDIGNLKIYKSAIHPWKLLRQSHNIFTGAISFADSMPAKKGSNNYFVPVFTPAPLGADSDKEAQRLDKEILQPYLQQIQASRMEAKEQRPDGQTKIEPIEEPKADEPIDDLPF